MSKIYNLCTNLVDFNNMALPPRDQRHQYFRVQVFDFGGLTELMDEGLRGRMLMEHRDAQGQKEMEIVGFGLYWVESGRQISDKGDLSAYWREISFERDFLGMDVGSVNVPYLLARYLRLFTSGRKQGAMISGDLPVIDMAELAPQPPPPAAGPARTMAQRLASVEEDVHVIRGAIGKQREILDSMARDFSQFSTWTVVGLSQMMSQAEVRYTSYADFQIPYLRRTRRGSDVIMEYLVKISKKAHILELKRRHLKIVVLTTNMPYPSRKIRRISTTTFKADYIDAYDSNCDDEATTNAIFMANLLPVGSLNDDTVGLRYDSDMLSEVPHYDTYHDSDMLNSNVQELGYIENIVSNNESYDEFTRRVSSTNTSGSNPRSNTKNDRIPQPSSRSKKNKVEAHHRKFKSSANKNNHVLDCNANVKNVALSKNSDTICLSCNECLFSANHDACVVQYLKKMQKHKVAKSAKQKVKSEWKLTGRVFTSVGLRWKPIGRMFNMDEKIIQTSPAIIVPPRNRLHTIRIPVVAPNADTRMRYSIAKNSLIRAHINSYGHLFNPPNFAFIVEIVLWIILQLLWDMEIYKWGIFLFHVFTMLKDLVIIFSPLEPRGSNLYTISMADMMKYSPVFLLSKASKTKSWLWHRHLSHLNFGTINQLAKQGLVKGFPKL
ncbi:integrase, catalytic region, zinc finger, CCHC-type containing protein [Tanacetum coccineum]